jgi:hypothetical protein
MVDVKYDKEAEKSWFDVIGRLLGTSATDLEGRKSTWQNVG